MPFMAFTDLNILRFKPARGRSRGRGVDFEKMIASSCATMRLRGNIDPALPRVVVVNQLLVEVPANPLEGYFLTARAGGQKIWSLLKNVFRKFSKI